MRVILLADVKGTGKKGDIKDVSDGYGRNFLLEKGVARLATNQSIRELEAQEERKMKEMEAELKTNQKYAGRLDGGEVEIHAKGNEQGTLYAAVNTDMFAQEIKKKFNIKIEATQVKFSKPVKEHGDYTVRVIFSHGLEAEMTLVVSP